MNAPLRKRYPGTRPFEDRPDDTRLFTGRDSEIEELCQRIASHRVLVLYAASGTGKTSLLRAGVFPKLRERGYLPLSVRFSGDESRSLLQQLSEEVARDAARPGQDAEIVEPPKNPGSFLHYFHETEFWSGNGAMSPVLVLDQFEEIFYLHVPQRRIALLRELAVLARGREESGASSTRVADNASRLRIVISLREDAVGHLAALGVEVPGLMDHAFRLPPLRDETAAKAITIPAGTEMDERYTPVFQCEKEAVDDLIGWLAEKSGSAVEELSGRISRSVESFVLQVFCEHIEDSVIRQRLRGDANAGFTTALLPGRESKETVLRRFYFRKLLQYMDRRPGTQDDSGAAPMPALKGMAALLLEGQTARDAAGSGRFRDISRAASTGMVIAAFGALMLFRRRGRAVLQLVENDLLTEDGRRQPRDRDSIARKHRLADDDIARLERLRLVRTEPHGGVNLLNLSHDQLAITIHRFRILRAARKVAIVYGSLLMVIGTIALSLWGIDRARNSREAAERKAQDEKATNEELRTMRSQAAQLAKDQARATDDPDKKIASLALAVRANPDDTDTFVQLLSLFLHREVALPDRLWLLRGDTTYLMGNDLRVVATDVDGIHYAVRGTGLLGSIQVLNAEKPWERPSSGKLMTDYKFKGAAFDSFALGNRGNRFVGLMPPRAAGAGFSTAQVSPKSAPFSADERTAARGGLWDLSKAEREPVEMLAVEGLVPGNALQLSPGGQWLTVKPAYSTNAPWGAEGIRIFRLYYENGETSRAREIISPAAGIGSVAFNPSDKMLVAITANGEAHLLSAQSSEKESWRKLERSQCRHALFSPDKAWFAVSTDTSTWITPTPGLSDGPPAWQELSIPPSPGEIGQAETHLAFSSDSRLLFAGARLNVDKSSQRPPATHKLDSLWSIQSGTRWELTSLLPPADLDYAASRPQADATVRWLLAGKILHDSAGTVSTDIPFSDSSFAASTLLPPPSPAQPVSINNPPFIRCIHTDGGVSEWNVRPLRRLLPDWQFTGGPGRECRLTADGDRVQIWNPESRKVWKAVTGATAIDDKSVELPEDWQPLNISANRWLIAFRQNAAGLDIGLWDFDNPEKMIFSTPRPEGPGDSPAYAAGVTSDGSRLLAYFDAGKGRNVELWSAPIKGQSLAGPWKNEGVGKVDFANGLLFSPSGAKKPTDVRVRSLNGAWADVILPLEAASEQIPAAFCPHPSGERLLVLQDAGDHLEATSFRKAENGWSRERIRKLSGCQDLTYAAVTDDWQWIAVINDNGEVFAWNSQTDVPTPPLSLTQGISYIHFVPGGSVLAMSTPDGRVALVDVRPWKFEAGRNEKLAFAQLASALASPNGYSEAILRSPATAQESRFVSPRQILFDSFMSVAGKRSPLGDIVEWTLGLTPGGKPHPFSPTPLAKWRDTCRDEATLPSVADALSVDPFDPVALALHGWLLARSPGVLDDAGTCMAALHHARATAAPNEVARINRLELEAMTALAEELNAARNYPASLIAIKRGERAAERDKAPDTAAWRDRLTKAHDEAANPPPKPDARPGQSRTSIN